MIDHLMIGPPRIGGETARVSGRRLGADQAGK
jgi:hypothetical protein